MTHDELHHAKIDPEHLVIEVCHDLINRAMRCEVDDDFVGVDRNQLRTATDCRAKEAAIRGLLAERDQLREQLIDTQDALWKACSLATTHRPEDRQEILALGKLGRLRK